MRIKFELILRLMGYNLSKADSYLKKQLNTQTIRQYHEKAKWDIVDYHIKHNKFYNDLVGNQQIHQWGDLPIMTKQHYQLGNIDNILSKGFSKNNTYISSTSGSSGHPFFFAKDKFCHALAWSLYRDRYSKYGIDLNSLQARFYGIPLESKAYLIEKLKDYLMNRVRFTVFDLSENKLEKYLSRFKTQRFEYIYGYSSSILLFARFVLKKKIVLREVCPSLKLVITTSEVCLTEDKKVIQEAFGVRVVDEYGASEIGIMAFTDLKGKMQCSDELVYFENYTKSDGTTALLCTSLYNKAFPIIRYEIGDSVELIQDKEGKNVINSIKGRVNDFVVLPSGKVSPGLTFYYISRSILESSGALREFIVRQTSVDKFVFEIVSDKILSHREESRIRQKVEQYIEKGLEVEFKYVQSIKRSKSGKLKHFFSEI